jgi:thiamine-phosphate pyrophosphorylase
MRARQTIPRRWLVLDDTVAMSSVQQLPRGSGVLVLQPIGAKAARALRQIANQRDLTVLQESARTAARVHDSRELLCAMLQRTPLILLSPLYPTSSHPDWTPIPRMRAAALAQLGRRKLLALGGMDSRRFARIKNLGFQGWAGISAFRT